MVISYFCDQKKLKKASILIGFLLISFLTNAQQAIVEGYVYDQTNKEPLPYATIGVQETQVGVITDSTGYFRLVIEPGLYNLEASYTGYNSLIKHELLVISGKPQYHEFLLEPLAINLESVEVKADGFNRTAESPTSIQAFSVNEIERMPGATLDISKFVKTLPGVAPRVSFGYNQIVRGGASNENRFFLDGIEIPAITHFTVQGTSGGPNGLLNSRMLRNAELFSGAFPASRPNALSSVLEISQREGRKDRFGGNFTLGATDFGFLFEGPMGKKSSFMLSARESFSQHMLKALGVPVLPFYSDVQYKQVIRFNPKNELILTGIGGYDKYTLNVGAEPSESLLYNTGYIPEGRQFVYAGGLVYKHYLENSYYTLVVSRNYFYNEADKYLDNSGEVQDHILHYLSKEAENKMRLEHRIFRGQSEWNYGVNLEQDQVETDNFSLYTFPDATIDTISYASDFSLLRYGAFVSHSRSFFNDRLDLFAGIRVDGNTFNEAMKNPLSQLSPRLSLSWSFAPQWRWNTSSGIYYQLPPYVVMGYSENGILINQDRLEYIRSAQLASGIEHTTNSGYQLKAEGFYKGYSDYPFLLLDSISFANANANYVLVGNQPADATGIGRAYGLEFSVKQKYTKSYFWNLSYSYVVSQFQDKNGNYVSTSWDNRHFATLAGGLRFGKNWQIGARWSVSGGSPWTPYNEELSGMRSVWDLNRRGVTDYSRLNEDQLPVFHQLDIRVDKQINFKKWTLAFFLDIQNAYSANIAALPYLTVQRDGEWNPIVDPNNSNNYLTQIISSDTGRVLPSLGVIIDY